MTQKKHIAYFITSHGFGHASRSVAVMSALLRFDASIHFDIFTKTPRWFFEEDLSGSFTYYDTYSDVGIVQNSPLEEDLPETIHRLDQFLPFNPHQLKQLEIKLTDNHCRLVICDISPLGIAAANAAGLPSVLIENFTWDWIYQNHLAQYPEFDPHIQYLEVINQSVSCHIQTAPSCSSDDTRDFFAGPISRPYHQSVNETRRNLSIPPEGRMVLLTMGGIPEKFNFLSKLPESKDIYYVIPGASDVMEIDENRVLLPHHSQFHHPDLIRASNAIIGKAGYSTIAEAYHAGVPFGYVTRSNFRESACLVDFIVKNMQGIEIPDTTFHQADWIDGIPQLLEMPVIQRNEPNGAAQVADMIGNSLLW